MGEAVTSPKKAARKLGEKVGCSATSKAPFVLSKSPKKAALAPALPVRQLGSPVRVPAIVLHDLQMAKDQEFAKGAQQRALQLYESWATKVAGTPAVVRSSKAVPLAESVVADSNSLPQQNGQWRLTKYCCGCFSQQKVFTSSEPLTMNPEALFSAVCTRTTEVLAFPFISFVTIAFANNLVNFFSAHISDITFKRYLFDID